MSGRIEAGDTDAQSADLPRVREDEPPFRIRQEVVVPTTVEESAVVLEPLQKPLPLTLVLPRPTLDHADDIVQAPALGAQPVRLTRVDLVAIVAVGYDVGSGSRIGS